MLDGLTFSIRKYPDRPNNNTSKSTIRVTHVRDSRPPETDELQSLTLRSSFRLPVRIRAGPSCPGSRHPSQGTIYFAASSGGTVNVTLPVAAHSTPRVNVTLKTCSVTALKSWPRASTNTRPWPYRVVHNMGSWTPVPDMGCLLRAADALSS